MFAFITEIDNNPIQKYNQILKKSRSITHEIAIIAARIKNKISKRDISYKIMCYKLTSSISKLSADYCSISNVKNHPQIIPNLPFLHTSTLPSIVRNPCTSLKVFSRHEPKRTNRFTHQISRKDILKIFLGGSYVFRYFCLDTVFPISDNPLDNFYLVSTNLGGCRNCPSDCLSSGLTKALPHLVALYHVCNSPASHL